MTKKEGEYSMASLKRSEARRQRVLDWLWAHGHSTFTDLFAGINEQARSEGLAEFPMHVMRGTMASMLQKRELAATGPHKAQVFIAIAKVTEPAESMRERKLEKNRRFCAANPRDRASDETKARRAAMNPEEVRQANIKATAEPWRTIHFAGDTPQSRDSRGQGALREKATVNCAMPI